MYQKETNQNKPTSSRKNPVARIRIYTPHGFVFDIPFDWVYASMKDIDIDQVPYNVPNHNIYDTIEYLRKLSWCEIQDKLQFVGIIDSPMIDSLASSVFDLPDRPFNYPLTEHKNFKLFLSKKQKDED
jgi:hypothetical protein